MTDTLASTEPGNLPWAVLYHTKNIVEGTLDPYSLLVLDSENHPELEPLHDKELYGYISMGEVEENRPWFSDARDAGLLVARNPDWPDSWFVDMRDPQWRNILLNQAIPSILQKGFDGLMMDTLDNAETLETADPERFGGMIDAAAELVKATKEQYPDVSLMMNRGYALPAEEVAPAIDIALAESTRSGFSRDANGFTMLPEEKAAEYRKEVDELRQVNPRLPVLSLDYINTLDNETLDTLYNEQQAAGYHPYVSTVVLDTLTARS